MQNCCMEESCGMHLSFSISSVPFSLFSSFQFQEIHVQSLLHYTPLHIAAMYGFEDIVKFLMFFLATALQ